jgi:Tfp pilus assembly protein PilO
MTGRDRMVLIGVIVLVVIAGGWMLVVSPEREKAKSLGAEVSAAQTALSTAEGQLASARAAQSQYAKAYSAVVSLGKAVPASQEVPSLIFQLAQATDHHNVDFNSIVTGASGSGSAAAGAGAVASAGFTQMPFTFVFNGSFFDLEHLFRGLTAFATHTTSGALQVNGRLLTIQSVKLSPETASAPSAKGGKQGLTGTITASAYVLPASQGLTGSATAASPVGAAAPSATSGSAPTAATAPAIARVTP